MSWQDLADSEGTARRVTDPDVHKTANAGSAFPRNDRFMLFELQVSSAFSAVYGSGGPPERQRWPARDRWWARIRRL